MQRLIAIIGLQCYAVALAFVQFQNGVRTDEAKYLLNIPYPHPPLARWFLSLFDGFAWQEVGVRVLFATLMTQAVWLVWDMGRSLKTPARIALAMLWLASAAFVLQAGTVMMAPVTALQALLFLWWLSRPAKGIPQAPTVAFVWLATLFTALQGVLLAPLAIAVLRLKGASWKQVAWYVGAPIVLVGLYALGNPLIVASFANQATMDAGNTLAMRGLGLLWVLALAGSGIGAIIGIVGLALKRHGWIGASFVLIALYVFIGRYDYYAILFAPFFITGAKHLWRRPRWTWTAVPTALLVLVCTALILTHHVSLMLDRSPARDVLQAVGPGKILVHGSMGHEWQYERQEGQDIRRYASSQLSTADAVVCMSACDDLGEEWELVAELPVDVFVRAR